MSEETQNVEEVAVENQESSAVAEAPVTADVETTEAVEPVAEAAESEPEAEEVAEPVAEAAESEPEAEEVAEPVAEAAESEPEAEEVAEPVAEAAESEPEAEEVAGPGSIDDLRPAMEVRGKVKAIELYGAFVDIGVGKDALLHISQLGERVRNVEDVVKKGETITAYILKVDKKASRIALSMEKPPENPMNALREGEVVTGEIVRIESFGAFVEFGAERPGMIHVSELASGFVKTPDDVVKIGQEVRAQIIKINRKKRQIDLSIRVLEEAETSATVAEMEEADEDMPTAMELALRRAMEEAQDDTPAQTSKSGKSKKKKSDQLEDILSRTLKEHGN